MRINEINRNAQSHGAYTATVQLKYDEAVFLQNAVHEYRKVHELNERQEFFCTEIFIMSVVLESFYFLSLITCLGNFVYSRTASS